MLASMKLSINFFLWMVKVSSITNEYPSGAKDSPADAKMSLSLNKKTILYLSTFIRGAVG